MRAVAGPADRRGGGGDGPSFSVVVGLAGVVERTERFRTFAGARRYFHAEAARVIEDIEAFVLLGQDHEPPAKGTGWVQGATTLASKSNGHRWVD